MEYRPRVAPRVHVRQSAVFVVLLANIPSGRANAGSVISTRLHTLDTSAPPATRRPVNGIQVARAYRKECADAWRCRPILSDLNNANETAQVFAHELSHQFGIGR